MRATARAHANIALVKYWGKRDAELNLPAAGSLSLTLGALTTTATVAFEPGAGRDELQLDGAPAPEPARARMSRWLDVVRARAGTDARARVISANDFPTASGLASSASAYAALAVAASRAAGLELPARELSALARRGSGSAARSVFGGLVLMHAGDSDAAAFAEPLEHDREWPLRMVIAIIGGGAPKAHGSRDAMEHCAATSPLHQGWLASVPGDLAAARAAITACDTDALGRVAERSAMTMHASAMAARPAILYWQPATVACLHEVQAMRAAGIRGYATIDAGPHVKVLTEADQAGAVAARLQAIDGVGEVIVSGIGGPAVELEG